MNKIYYLHQINVGYIQLILYVHLKFAYFNIWHGDYVIIEGIYI